MVNRKFNGARVARRRHTLLMGNGITVVYCSYINYKSSLMCYWKLNEPTVTSGKWLTLVTKREKCYLIKVYLFEMVVAGLE